LKFKREIIIISLIIAMLFTVSAVCAANSEVQAISAHNSTDTVVSTANDDNLKMNDANEILAETDDFTALNEVINGNSSNNYIELDNDYQGSNSYNNGKGIEINRANVVIDGKGHTIDCTGETSRMFNIIVDGITLKNINFIGGSFTHGGAIYTNKYLTIINCTFKDNQATGASSNAYGGGAIYASGAGNISVLNSTFINNHATKNGGAIDIYVTSDVDSKIDHCVFISNTADNLAGLLFTTNKGTVNITNSIIINNTCNSGYTANDIIYAGTTVYVDNNWWGSTVNNRSDYPVYISDKVVPNNWYYLDLNVNSILDQADISLNNLYMYDGSSVSIIEDDHYNLPNVSLNISAINANVVNNVSLDKYGKSTISYTTTSESGYLGVSYYTTEITKPISQSGNTFTDLQNVINSYNEGSTVILKKDYVFDSTTDSSLTGGVKIPYSMTIDGQGHSIDAKGQGRIFLVYLDGSHDVTFENIIFLNGSYAQRGGAIYSAPDGGDGSIINCTFINNQVTGNSYGGAVSIYAGIKNIINSTFIDCSAPYGGAIQSQFDPCNVLNCTFIDNKATYYSDYGGAIYLESGIISDSIFINNPDVPIYSYGTVTANNNWFGNTIDNFDVAPSIDSVTVDNWYVLDLDIDHNGVATVSLNNLYENGILDKSNTYYNLPPITVNVKGTNVDIDENVTLDKTGKATIAFTPTDSYSITVTYKNIKLTKEMKPSFTYLNSLINNLQTQTLDLEDDFEYYSDSDSALSGGILLDENIIIDGHGHYIDAKGQSCIFNVNDDSKNLVLKNIRFSNAKGLNGAVVYFKGNKIEIINCTFENNSAENEGDAVYIAGINEASSIEKCAFINNKGTNSVIYIGSDNIQFDIKNSIFLNNTDLNIKGSANVVATYDWFGHNASNYDDNSLANVDGRISLNNYLFLNISYTSDIITISLNNLYDGNVGSYDDCSVPSVKLNVKNENLTVGNNAIIAENGKCELDYAINALTGSLTAYYEDISYTKDIAFIDDGSFSALQLIINTAQGNIINLERNYTYNPNKDSALVTGITFTKPMTIIGKGNVKIDAKDMARIFNVNQDITFRNISFVNGNVLSLSSQRGAAIYNNGGNCRFINCSFINNTAYQGGAIYNSQNTLNQFENCTFINNTATSQGGVINNYQGFAKFIDSIFVNNSATGSGGVYFTEFYGYDYYDNCTFINNSAKMSAVINSGTTGTTYDKKIINSTFIGNRVIDGSDTSTNTIIFSYGTAVEGCIFNDNTAASIIYSGFSNSVVKNSIFLNNTANYVITGSSPSSITADYNWFGNNATNYNVRPNVPTNLLLNNWYVLNITATKFNAIISLNNLYDGSDVQKDYADYALPNITLDIKSINLNVQNNVTLNKTGKTQIPFTLTSDRGLLSLTKGSTLMSKEIELGDFDILQNLINENDVVELTRNYAYDLDFDIITEGVLINKPNLVINGNGFTIDAKGKSRIFKITENGAIINNVTFINAKHDSEGGAIYCSGDDCTITSSIFVNNTATSGSAFYLTGTNGKINDCIFVNNHGDDDINAPNDLNADYNWFGNNASNYNINIAKVEGFTLNNWYFLNMTLMPSSANIDLNNVYVVLDQNNVTNDNCALPNTNFKLTGENVTVQNDIVINQKGNVPITPLYKDLSLTASFETASYTVNKTLQGDFAILQQLINDAGADGIVNLDRNYTYIVGADTITEGIDIFYRNVSINGNGFTINALGKSLIFKVGSNAHNLTINNVTFINAGGSSGGAIYWNSAKNGNIINSRFINNTCSNGGGAIYFSGGNINIINSTFKDNSAPQNGGAFYLFSGASVLINNSTFINNTAQNGGVIYVYSGSMSINKSDFINNTVRATGSTKVYGGVIYCQVTFSDEIDIMNSNFINNGAESVKGNCYGGVIYVPSGIMNIANSTFNRNYITSTSATTYGTVFYWSNAKCEIINSSFLNNHGKSSSGSAIYITGASSNANVTNSIFINNTYGTSNSLKVLTRSSGNIEFNDCWFGNTKETSGEPMGTTTGPGISYKNKLDLYTVHDEYMAVGEDKEIEFVLQYVESGKVIIYDSSKLPKVDLTLSAVNGEIDRNSASMNETILFNANQFGPASITAKFNGIELTENLYAKDKPTITVEEPIVVHVDESVSVNIQKLIPQDASLTFSSIDGDEFIYVTFNGYVEGLKEGNSTLYIHYGGNENYVPATVEVPVTVIKYTTSMSCDVDSISVDWGADSQSVTIDFDNGNPDFNPEYPGQYDQFVLKFKSNDTNVATVSIVEGKPQINFYSAGTANVTFYFEGNEKYYASEKNITVTVNKVPSSLTILDDVELDYGSSGTTTLTLDGATVDDVNIIVENHPEAVIGYENNVVTVSSLDVGTYTLKVTTTPDENHTSVSATANITVTKVDSSVEFESDVEFDYLQSGTTKLINFVGCSVDLVNITVECQTGATIDYNDVTKVITVSGLDAGTYTLKVTTTPDSNHNPVDVTSNITVNKIDSSVTFDDIEFDYLGFGTTTISDYDGCTVDLANIVVVGHPEAVIEFENNVITVSGLGAGTHTLNVTTTPNANYKSKSVLGNIKVNPIASQITLNNTNIVYKYDESNSTNLTLVGCSVDLINITVDGNNVAGVTYDAETQVITISGLDVGIYELKVVTTPDENHTSVYATASITVEKSNSSVRFSNPVFLFYSEEGTTTLTLNGCTVDNINVVGHPEAIIDYDEITNVVTVSGLAVGDYTLKVVTTPDGNHLSVENTTSVSVGKESSKLVMEYSNVTVGEKEYVYVSMIAAGEVKITISDGDSVIRNENVTIADNGFNKIIFTDLKVGTYTISAYYKGHGKYNDSTLNYKLVIRPIYEYAASAVANDTVMGNTTNVTVTLPEDATGKIVIGDIEVKITEPVTVIELPSSAVVGTNNVTVKYVPDADSKYAPRELVALYNVAKVDTEIVLEITNSTTANPVTIVANINATGNVTFIVNGKEYSRKITQNKSTLELSDVAGGEYSVTAVYAGNAKYVNSTAGDKFTVEKIASEIEEFIVDPGEIQTDGTATVTVKVPGSGIVTITVNGKDTNVTVNEGVAELTLSDLPKGETIISAKYLGDDKYNGIETEEKTLTVKPVLDYDFTVDVANITVGDDAIAYIMLPSDATGNINVSVSKGKDVLKSENITSIKYVIPLKLDVGTYNITAKYYGNDKYDVKTVTKQFSVNPLNVGKLNFTVVVNDTLVGQETNVTVSLPSDATGKLVINGQEYEIGEKITLTPGPAGINNVTVRYVPDENSKYGEDNVTAFYNVAKKVSKITITPITGVKAGQMVFVDARTNSNGDIIVYIDGVKANAMDVSAGVHTVVASVAETDEYLASSANYTFTVAKYDADLTVSGTPALVGEKSTITVDITPGATGIVVVNVNGTEYSIDISKTNVLNVVMHNAGTASLSARYLGDDYYNAKDAEATTIEVTEKPVRDDYNVPSLDDVKVGDEVEIHVADDMDVYVDGIKQTPDENGNVTLPATAGEHSVVIVANETSENKAVFDVTTYNVAKNDVEISVRGTPTLAGEKSTITVDIAPDATGIVVINVNGTEYSLNISDNKSIEVVMSDAGNASLSARFLGDDKYAAKDVKGEPIAVTEKQDGVIDIPEIGVIEVGETRTIDDIPSNVDIYIDGNKTVPVSGQVIIPSTAGAHTIIAMVNETPTTKAAVKVVAYEVVKKESKIEIELSDIEVGKPVTITVDAGARTVDVVYIDGKEYTVTDGYVEFVATSGTHTVIASLNETDEYLPVTANRTFEVSKKDSEIEISSDDSVTVGQSIIISIDITPDTTGNVLVNVNGTVYSISLPERNLEIVLDKVGSYNITATYMGDDKFNGSVSNALTVNVEDKAVSKIDVQIPEDNRVGEEIIINVTSDVTPEVYVDGKKQNYRNGKVVIPSLEAGIHTIEVIIPETENNKANSTVKTFTVSKKDSSVKINGIDGDLIVDKFNKLNFNYEGNTVIVYLDGEVLTDYDLFKAAAGTHIITATVVEDSEYTSSSANYTFEIAKNTAEISVDGGYTTVGMKTTINVNIVDEATGIVIVNVNGTEYSLNISQTKSLDVVLTQPGEYDISARYLGDDKYDEAVSEPAKIVVADKKDGEIIIDAPQTTVYAGDDIEISVTSYGDGELTVTVDGIEQTLDQGTLTINNISAGNHTIVAVTPETAEYKESREVKVIEVVKKDTEISINVLSDEIYAGEDVEVEILSDNDDIIVTVDGVIHTIENGILTIKNISAGSHTIEAVKYEDDEFNEYTAIEIIHAEKQSAEVSITVPQNVKAGDDVTIEVSSYDGADITVYVDGVKHEVNDGKVTIKATAGKHTVTASVDETYTHLASNDTKTFDVVKKDSSIEITATNVTEGQATTITVNTQLNEGIVVVKVGDKQAAVDLAKSKSVSITLDAPGTYEVSAEYLGSDIYAPAEASNITVEAAEKTSPEVNVTIPSVKAGEDETISVSIPNATGEVHVIVDGVDNIIPLDENGKANYTIPQMTAGDHSIVVVYPGDDTHDSKVVSQSITVDKQSAKADITVPEDIKAGETANVTVNIPGATGNVSVIIDGAETVVPLDENGSAVIPVSDIAGGKHSVVVVYDGDDTHDGFHDSKSFDVAQMKSAAFKDITVESSSISAVLADENGNPIKDALITYKINGKQSTTKTDDKGMFTINGISKAAVEFAYEGNDSIEPVNMSIDLQGISPIKTATEIKGEDFAQFACEYYEGERGSNFTFRLVDSQGKALANKQLYIGYNGVTLNRTTDENGYASVQINLKNAGLYTFVIVFLGDSDYNASMAVHKVTINKKTTSISAGAKTFKASAKTKKYTVTLKTIKGASIDGKTYLAAGKKVTLKINGKTYTAKTNAKGQATFSLKITKKGIFTTKISFDGDVTYEASSKSVKITIK